jgi:hypothetical protein
MLWRLIITSRSVYSVGIKRDAKRVRIFIKRVGFVCMSLFLPELRFVFTFLSFISEKACDLQHRVENSELSFSQANCLKMQSGRFAQIFIIPCDITAANYTSL